MTVQRTPRLRTDDMYGYGNADVARTSLLSGGGCTGCRAGDYGLTGKKLKVNMETNNMEQNPEINRDGNDVCPKCGGHIIMVEYSFDDPNYYDGTSEYACERCYLTDGNKCDYRIGRFCGKRLHPKEIEPPYCKGVHPVHI